MEVKVGQSKRHKWVGLLLLAIIAVSLHGEIFNGSSFTFDAVYLAGAEWGDFDNDGDLDILFTGYEGNPARDGLAKVYRNIGNAFEPVTTTFLGAGASSLNFVDVNNDGLMDVFITGQSVSQSYNSKLYINNGNDNFAEHSFAFQGVTTGSSDWNDMDQDGYKDLLLTGTTLINEESTDICYIYKNNAGNSFTLIAQTFPGVSNSSARWCDYDNDGDADFAITGTSSNGYICKVYKNNGNNSFSEVSGNFVGVRYSRVRWADYDSDGDQDLIVTGSNNNATPSFIKIYRNDGNDNFAVVNPNIPGARQGDVNLADFNNDGYLDIVIGGLVTTSIYTGNVYLYQPNTQNYTVSDSLLESKYATYAIADYDNDGDIDLHFTGRDVSVFYNQIYNNTSASTSPNTLPGVVNGLTSQVTGNNVLFNWSQGTDAQTLSSGLSYNLFVGTSPTTMNIVSAEANISNGWRKVCRQGNMESKTSYLLKNLSPGTYYWSVQALDNCFAGSNFAEVQSFTITDPLQTTAQPVFSPEGGLFENPVTVSITCSTENSQIWYTTDGSIPQQGGNLYSEPLMISSNTTLKAIATSSLMPSSVSQAVYRFPIPITSISELRATTIDNETIYKLNNEVLLTAKHSYRNQKFIQDANAGLMIDDQNNILQINPNIGDGIINLTGHLTTFDGMLQFIPAFNSASISSSNNVIEPIVSTLLQISQNPTSFESRLIRLHSVDFNIGGNFTLNQNVSIDDNTGVPAFFKPMLYNVDYLNTSIPDLPQSIAGIYTRSATEHYLTARSLNDFTDTFPAPSNFVGQVGDASIMLTWENPDSPANNLTGYQIIKNGSEYLNPELISPTESSYFDHDIELGNAYSYIIVAIYGEPYVGTSVPSNTVTIQYGDAILPPLNLQAEVQLPSVNLSWQAPGSTNASWIHWDSGEHTNNLGTSDASADQMIAAVRFEPQDISQYNNMYLTKVRFWPHAPNCQYSIRVWQGGNQSSPGTQLIDQPVFGIVIDQWNEVTLTTPIQINANQELWFGVHYSTSAGYPAGTDAGPAINYKGNMMWWDGQWTTLLNLSATQDRNWNIQGFVGYAGNRDLLSFNIYKNSVLLENVPANQFSYTDVVEEGIWNYQIKALYTGDLESIASNTVTVNTTSNDQPEILMTQLKGNYPNPFNPETNIHFSLRSEAQVSLKIYNIKGELVRTLINSPLSKGDHKILWDGKDQNQKKVSSGVYFYKMQSGTYSEQKKMLLLK